jgi:thiamine biosynthesis lipoprotein
MLQHLTRRRMIVIAASAAGSAFLASSRFADANAPVRWQGSALGAQVSIEIHHPDRAEAERLVERCVLEVRGLEQQFSLYRTDSAISILNRTGILVAPDADMVALLRTSLLFSDLTDGAFDPAVQPLWRLYADHFLPGPDSESSPEKLTEGWRVGARAFFE